MTFVQLLPRPGPDDPYMWPIHDWNCLNATVFPLLGTKLEKNSIRAQQNSVTKHLAGKVVNQRHNTGLDHKGHYLNMAQVLAIENRVTSAHQSDTPLIAATKVNYYPTSEDISTMKEWCTFFIAKTLINYFPAGKTCSRFVKWVSKHFFYRLENKEQ